MTIAEQLWTAAQLMLLGMGTVFGFLTVLVFTLYGMSKLTTMIERNSLQSPTADSAIALRQAASQDADDELTAVISVAIARYKTLHRR